MAQDTPPPSRMEFDADVIAVGVMGAPVQCGGERAVRLHVERVLKGVLFSESVNTQPPRKSFACCTTDEPDVPADLYREGTRTLIYLAGSEQAGWQVLRLRRLDEETERQELPRVQHGIEVALGCRAVSGPDPPAAAQAFELLLREQARLPIGDAHLPVLLALRDAARNLNPAERQRLDRTWVGLLTDYRPSARPTEAERRFFRRLAEILAAEPLAADMQDRCRALHDAQPPGWYRDELGRVLR